MKKYIALLAFLLFFFSDTPAQDALINDLISQGIKFHDQGDYADAVDRYKKALALSPRSARANYEIASSYLALKNYSKTIKHCDIVINDNIDYVDQAYMLKGSAQDLLGNPLEAIKTFQKGIQKYKTNPLLYYNYALTLFKIKNYRETEESLQQSLKLDPSHASSHFLLALTMLFQEQRVKGMLALYNYLLLEPKNKRTASALLTLEEEMQKSLGIDSASERLSRSGKAGEDEFHRAEIMLCLSAASKTSDLTKLKMTSELFVENTNTLFTLLGELKKDQKGFWWNFYVDYFYTLSLQRHTEAFCHYITQSKGDAYTEWLKDNRPKIEAFSSWYVGYLHKH